MAGVDRNIPRRLEAFIAVACRVEWTLPRTRQRFIWETLQVVRASRKAPSLTTPRSAAILRGWRHVLAPRTVTPLLGTAALVIGAVLILSRPANDRPWHHELPLNHESEDAVSALGDLQGPGDISFTDGTSIGVGAASKIAVERVTSMGADVRLLAGSVEVRVRPRPHARWTFGAGPFQIEVKGTSFRLDWQPDDDRMTLTMWSGEVVVHRGGAREEVTVTAGESVVLTGSGELSRRAAPGGARGAGADIDLPHPGPEGGPPLGPAGGDDAQPPGHRPGSSGRERRVREAASGRDSWPELLARGAFAEIVAQAERRGIALTLAHGSDADIAAFADAARYTRQNHLARRGLLALLRRFPGSGRARNASFFLGRLGESTDPESALGWYDRYLRESPHGPYVEGAMAREMVLLRQDGSSGRARILAERYLRQYPDGTYRDLAIGLSGIDVR